MTKLIQWTIRGYAGQDDYDGPSDYNFRLRFITDDTVTTTDIDAIVQHRYQEKRALTFDVQSEPMDSSSM